MSELENGGRGLDQSVTMNSGAEREQLLQQFEATLGSQFNRASIENMFTLYDSDSGAINEQLDNLINKVNAAGEDPEARKTAIQEWKNETLGLLPEDKN